MVKSHTKIWKRTQGPSGPTLFKDKETEIPKRLGDLNTARGRASDSKFMAPHGLSRASHKIIEMDLKELSWVSHSPFAFLLLGVKEGGWRRGAGKS